MSALTLDGLGWTWADGTLALDGVSLGVEPGERVLLTGPSGCGKSTLLRLVAGLLPQHGEGARRGGIAVDGVDPSGWSGADRARGVGVVFQEPADQLVAGTAADEVRFGGLSAGIGVDALPWLARVGLAGLAGRAPQRLSGGQQQRLATAAALAAGARLLLLDEPLAHLDPPGADALLERLSVLATSGTAVLLVEHRLEAALDWADRVIVLRGGRVVWDGGAPDDRLLAGDGLQLPPLRAIAAVGGLAALGPASVPARPVRPDGVALRRDAIARGGRTILRDIDVSVGVGEWIAIVGPNGVGKSTLLAALDEAAGPRAVRVPQDPDLALFCPTVADELAYGPRERGVSPVVGLADFGLDGLADRPPHALSRGQRLRLAVASAAAVGPELLLLDEPTAGQHADVVRAALAALRRARPDGAVVFATHDVGLALAVADRVWVLGDGAVRADGPPEQALLHVPLPPLQREQVARGWPLAPVERQLGAAPGPAGAPIALPEPVRASPEPPEPDAPTGGRPGAVIAVLAVGSLAVLLERPASLALLAGASLGVLLTRPIGAVARGRIALGVAGVAWSAMLSQGLFYGDAPRTAWIGIGPVVLWREGLYWGAVQSLRLIAVGSAGLALALTSAPDRLLGVLRGLGVSGPLAFLAITALRFVPVVAGEWATVRSARARRGRPLHRRGPVGWLRTELVMLRPLVGRAVRRAGRLAEALDSRGFDPRVARAPIAAWTTLDRVVATGCGLAVAAVVALRVTLALYLWEVAGHPSLNPVYAWVRAWL